MHQQAAQGTMPGSDRGPLAVEIDKIFFDEARLFEGKCHSGDLVKLQAPVGLNNREGLHFGCLWGAPARSRPVFR
jgi:hypothetical protein